MIDKKIVMEFIRDVTQIDGVGLSEEIPEPEPVHNVEPLGDTRGQLFVLLFIISMFAFCLYSCAGLPS